MIDLIECLAIPDSCYLGKRLFKKLFYANGQLSATDKKIFSQDIEDIEWLYTLKPETINIKRYEDEEREYHEIAIIRVNLQNTDKHTRIAQIIQRTIPYPILIVFCNNSFVALNVASKRINKADKEKIMVEEFQNSPWLNLEAPLEYEKEFLQSLTITNFSYDNFFTFYTDLTERIVALNCAEHSGCYTAEASPEYGNRAETLAKIDELQKQQTGLRSFLQKESQFSQKVEMNMQIKKLTEQIESHKAKL